MQQVAHETANHDRERAWEAYREAMARAKAKLGAGRQPLYEAFEAEEHEARREYLGRMAVIARMELDGESQP